MDPQALELIKIAHAFESDHGGAGPAAVSSGAGGARPAEMVQATPGVVERAAEQGNGLAVQSLALQNILKGKAGPGRGASVAPSAREVPTGADVEPIAPASSAPAGFAGTGGKWSPRDCLLVH